MANRRMFEREIMELDDFVDMPASTRLLYVYIALDADDEGFLGSPKKVMRAFGGSEDDIKILIAKGFLIAFESGVVVVTHWHEHNKIRKDRIKATRYIEEKQSLQLVDLQWQKPSDNQVSTKCQPSDNQMSAQVSIGLGLDLVEDSIDIEEKRKESLAVFECWNSQLNTTTHRTHKDNVESAYKSLIKDKYTEEEILTAINAYNQALGTPDSWLDHKWTLKEFLSNEKACRKFIDCNGDYNWLKKNQNNNRAKTQEQETAERYGTWKI